MSELSFQNTSVAFAHKSDSDLSRAKLLFKSFNFTTLLTYGPALAKIAVAFGLKFTIKRTIFKQFCGGETISECDFAIKELANSGIGTILDYSVEGEDDESACLQTAAEILKTIEKAKGNHDIPFSVFKTTGIIASKDLEWASGVVQAKNICSLSELQMAIQSDVNDPQKMSGYWNDGLDRFMALCDAAANADVRIFIDAEETWIQPAIDLLATQAMEKFNTQKALVFNTLQMYRHDRLAYLKAQVSEAKCHYGYKLVRGAYMEKERNRAKEMGYEDPIQPNKEATDSDYDTAVKFCIDNHDRVAVCIATHNENSSILGTQLLNEAGIEKNHWDISFSQLLGMSDHISFNLSNSGYKVSKYVPYGPVLSVIPYLTRRAQENSGMAGQMGRELALIEQEIKRRKL